MELAEKDVIIHIGPLRTGKGTTLAALKGIKMKFISSESLEDDAFCNMVMSTVDKNGNPVTNEIISHQRNSYTLKP